MAGRDQWGPPTNRRRVLGGARLPRSATSPVHMPSCCSARDGLPLSWVVDRGLWLTVVVSMLLNYYYVILFRCIFLSTTHVIYIYIYIYIYTYIGSALGRWWWNVLRRVLQGSCFNDPNARAWLLLSARKPQKLLRGGFGRGDCALRAGTQERGMAWGLNSRKDRSHSKGSGEPHGGPALSSVITTR